MDVVRARLALYDFHFHLLTPLFYNLDAIAAHCFVYDLPPVFWRKYHMVFTSVVGMSCTLYFIFHLV